VQSALNQLNTQNNRSSRLLYATVVLNQQCQGSENAQWSDSKPSCWRFCPYPQRRTKQWKQNWNTTHSKQRMTTD